MMSDHGTEDIRAKSRASKVRLELFHKLNGLGT